MRDTYQLGHTSTPLPSRRGMQQEGKSLCTQKENNIMKLIYKKKNRCPIRNVGAAVVNAVPKYFTVFLSLFFSFYWVGGKRGHCTA